MPAASTTAYLSHAHSTTLCVAEAREGFSGLAGSGSIFTVPFECLAGWMESSVSFGALRSFPPTVLRVAAMRWYARDLGCCEAICCAMTETAFSSETASPVAVRRRRLTIMSNSSALRGEPSGCFTSRSTVDGSSSSADASSCFSPKRFDHFSLNLGLVDHLSTTYAIHTTRGKKNRVRMASGRSTISGVVPSSTMTSQT